MDFYLVKKLIKTSLLFLDSPIRAISAQSPGSPLYLVGTKMSLGSNVKSKDPSFGSLRVSPLYFPSKTLIS